MGSPMHQFQIQKVLDLPTIDVAGVPIDLSLTNSTVAMFIAAGVMLALFGSASMGAKVIPGRVQVIGESLFGLIDDLATSIIGHYGKKFFPFVFSLFLLIAGMNLLGMFLMFTATSQLAVTLTLGLLVIATVIGVGLYRHGLGFFGLFVPSGVPILIVPLVSAIEVVSFIARPITLALRLFGNMMGGHIVMKLFAGFVYSLAAAGIFFLPVAALSMGMVVALTALEFMVAFLQAFVFAVLTCVYLNDVVNLHGH